MLRTPFKGFFLSQRSTCPTAGKIPANSPKTEIKEVFRPSDKVVFEVGGLPGYALNNCYVLNPYQLKPVGFSDLTHYPQLSTPEWKKDNIYHDTFFIPGSDPDYKIAFGFWSHYIPPLYLEKTRDNTIPQKYPVVP